MRDVLGLNIDRFSPVVIVLGILLSLAVSIIADRYFDKPVTSYLRTTFLPRPQRPQPTS